MQRCGCMLGPWPPISSSQEGVICVTLHAEHEGGKYPMTGPLVQQQAQFKEQQGTAGQEQQAQSKQQQGQQGQ